MSTAPTQSALIYGEVASSGLARGPAIMYNCSEELVVPRYSIEPGTALQEMERLDAAIAEAESELLRLQQEIHRRVGPEEAKIFEAQILLLHDESLREKVSALCLKNQINVEAALDEAIVSLASAFLRLENPYFRERAADLRDVGKRLLGVLTKGPRPEIPALADGGILVTTELLPSVMAQVDRQTIRGMIVEKGGQTAHSTILARAQGIALLIHVPDATTRIQPGDQLIVDGLAGRVFINPSPEVLGEYDRSEAQLQAHQSALSSLIDLPAVTLDGVSVELCANIGKSADGVMAVSMNADGVGLYRTEFAFLVHDQFPTEEEQYEVYRTTAERLKPRPTVIRMLDIGSDKLLPYFPLPHEDNPSLGRRGTRLLLAHPEILHTQLRAILRLSATHPVSVLFPMVGGLEDILGAKAAIEKVMKDLEAAQQPFNPKIPVGAMIETPAAAIMAQRLAREVDFFSIGTNDLVQYLLTADRGSSDVSAYYDPLHPAILKTLATVASIARTAGKKVSICGEMAGNPQYTELLLGLGFRSLSVSPAEILEIKNMIRSTNLTRAEQIANQILEFGTIQEIKEYLKEARMPVAV